MSVPTALLLAILILPLLAAAAADSGLVADLTTLQSQSPDGVIRLNDHLISHFVTSPNPPRPYHLLIFFYAAQLHDNLRELRREFGLLSSSFAANNPSNASELFFGEVEFEDSQSTFSLFGVNSLPHIRLVGPNVGTPKDSEQMDQGDISRMAESMAEFIESRTGLTVGPIQRPPVFSKKQLGFLIAVLVIWSPFLIRKLLTGRTPVHDRKTWLAGSLFVYFFSVSGAMFNIIRKMPMFISDRNDPSKKVFFYRGSGRQFGAEGFAVGSLYTVVGLVIALITHLVVRVRNPTAQRVIMVLAMVVCFKAVQKVVSLDNWKTGYRIHAFWPTSWR